MAFRTSVTKRASKSRNRNRRGTYSFGIARKLLNIFLRNSFYTTYLAKRFQLARAERTWRGLGQYVANNPLQTSELRTSARRNAGSASRRRFLDIPRFRNDMDLGSCVGVSLGHSVAYSPARSGNDGPRPDQSLSRNLGGDALYAGDRIRCEREQAELEEQTKCVLVIEVLDDLPILETEDLRAIDVHASPCRRNAIEIALVRAL